MVAGVVAVVAAVAVAVFSAPAGAVVLELSVSDTTHRTGRVYTLSARCDFRAFATFFDNGRTITDTDPFASIHPEFPPLPDPHPLSAFPGLDGVATIRWVPEYPGTHTLAARGCTDPAQPDTTVEIMVEVVGG